MRLYVSSNNSTPNQLFVVSSEKIPASVDALATITQFTSPRTAEIPIVTITICATVLNKMDLYCLG